jgi:hypothetical protein
LIADCRDILGEQHDLHNCTPLNKIADVEREVAIAIAKVAYFISPKAVRRLAELNCHWQTEFEANYGSRVISANYFYEGSACVFPGVRRRANQNERKRRLLMFHQDFNAIFDDNRFPRHLWCFLCTGQHYTGQQWKKSGLREFELAHVLPHKATEVASVKKWFDKTPLDDSLHGLFTCAANVILLPKGMARPTDGTAGIRLAILKRYADFYGDTHAGGFGGMKLGKSLTWFGELRWNDPIEPPDWESRIAELHEFRKKQIGKLLAPMAGR